MYRFQERGYWRWSEAHTALVIMDFKPYLTGEKGKKYPGKITMY